MIATTPLSALALAHERGHELRREAAAARLRGTSAPRHVLAASLRRVCDLLDPTQFARRAATG